MAVALSTQYDDFQTFEKITETFEPGKNCSGFIMKHNLVSLPKEPGNPYNQLGYRDAGIVRTIMNSEDAKGLLQNHRYTGNRRVDNSWAKNLSINLEYGDITIAYVPGHFPVIVNGHHTLVAIANMTKNIPVFIKLFECESGKAFAYLYGTFDSLKKRTFGNILCNYLETIDDSNKDIPIKIRERVSTCVRQAKDGFVKRANVPNSEKLNNSQDPEVLEFSRFLHNIMTENQVKLTPRLLPHSLIAGFFAIWSSNRDKGTEFITKYISSAGTGGLGDPAVTLKNKITERTTKTHAGDSYNDFIVYVYKCWSAYKRGNLITPKQCTKACRDVPPYDRW